MPYHLIHSPLSRDTVEGSRDILALAESGTAVGLAVVVLLKRRRFMVDVFGEVERDPVFTRGALLELDECLREIAHRRRDSGTTI